MTRPVLSVVVPISGMAGRLNNLSNWLLKLQYDEIEVILVHDKRDAQTALELSAIVRNLCFTNLHLFEVSLGSPGLTRNFGMNKANGKWVQFVDSDDIPNLNESLDVIKEASTSTEVIRGLYKSYDSSQDRFFYQKETSDRNFDLALNPGIWRFIFRRDTLKGILFSRYMMGEDQLFLLDYGIFSREIIFSDSLLYTYFINQKNQLTSQRGSIRDLLHVLNRTISIYENSDQESEKYISVFLARQLMTAAKNFPFSTFRLLIDSGLLGHGRFTYLQKIALLKAVRFVLGNRGLKLEA